MGSLNVRRCDRDLCAIWCHRALQSIENVTIQKEQSITQKAKDIAAGAGESDLRRLERQFASLKNTYMLYDTKEHFLDGMIAHAVLMQSTSSMHPLLSIMHRRSCVAGTAMNRPIGCRGGRD